MLLAHELIECPGPHAVGERPRAIRAAVRARNGLEQAHRLFNLIQFSVSLCLCGGFFMSLSRSLIKHNASRDAGIQRFHPSSMGNSDNPVHLRQNLPPKTRALAADE